MQAEVHGVAAIAANATTAVIATVIATAGALPLHTHALVTEIVIGAPRQH